MAWIESHQSLLTHRKTGRMARALSISKITAIGHLHALWWWCLDNAPKGSLAGIDVEDIADGACWEGDPEAFINGLVYAGFIDRTDSGCLMVHDWMDFAGKLIDRRTKDAERKRDARKDTGDPRTSDGHPADGVRTQPNPTVPDTPKGVSESVGGSDDPQTSDGHPSDVNEESTEVGRDVVKTETGPQATPSLDIFRNAFQERHGRFPTFKNHRGASSEAVALVKRVTKEHYLRMVSWFFSPELEAHDPWYAGKGHTWDIFKAKYDELSKKESDYRAGVLGQSGSRPPSRPQLPPRSLGEAAQRNLDVITAGNPLTGIFDAADEMNAARRGVGQTIPYSEENS